MKLFAESKARRVRNNLDTMNKIEQKNYHHMRRHNRIRAKVKGTALVPRLAIFRSARFITAQLIDDTKGVTLAQATDLKIIKGTKVERAKIVGADIAAKAKQAKIEMLRINLRQLLFCERRLQTICSEKRAGLTFRVLRPASLKENGRRLLRTSVALFATIRLMTNFGTAFSARCECATPASATRSTGVPRCGSRV